MTQLVAIDGFLHRHIKVKPESCLIQQSSTHLVPVVLTEFRQLCAQYPIVLTKNSETGRFVCAALMGFEEGENLFLDNGVLTDSIVLPLNFARQPFYLRLAEREEDMVVCFDQDHPAISEASGTPIFTETGEQSKLMQEITSILATLYRSDKETIEFVQTLVEAELITPIQLNITFDDDSKCEVNGLYSIDEKALAGLDAEVLLRLNRKGFLTYLYLMIASLGQVQMMVYRKNKTLRGIDFASPNPFRI